MLVGNFISYNRSTRMCRKIQHIWSRAGVLFYDSSKKIKYIVGNKFKKNTHFSEVLFKKIEAYLKA